MPTASGDADHYIVRFYRAFPRRSASRRTSRCSAATRAAGIDCDVAAHLLAQDLIYVGGGSVVSLLGVWRAHGLDEVLRHAWQRGTVLCGLSAGSLCWFQEAITAFHGAPTRIEGLGLLPWSNCVHYDGEPGRRAEYLAGVEDGMTPGYAADDGAALHFVGSELDRVVKLAPGRARLPRRGGRRHRARDPDPGGVPARRARPASRDRVN